MGELMMDRRLNGHGDVDPAAFLEELHRHLAAMQARDDRAWREQARQRRLTERLAKDALALFALALVGLLVSATALVLSGAWAAWLALGVIGWLVLSRARKD